MNPLFSIIIPAFNRATELERALRSVRSQKFTDYEIIVVDDCSTDDTVQVARRFEGPGFRLVQRSVNGGPSQARNSGIDASRGCWLVMLDSDFSFRDAGALDRLANWCKQMPRDVGNCTSACVWDNGCVSPRPMPASELDYHGYLRWLESVDISEYFNCVRREVFAQVRYANSRAWESSFHLGLAKRWKLRFFAEPIVCIHTDAKNRLTTGRGRYAYRRMLADAADKRADIAEILAEHGDQLAQNAPRVYTTIRREAMKQSLLAGSRYEALCHWWVSGIALRDWRQFVILSFGLVHRCLLAWANSLRIS